MEINAALATDLARINAQRESIEATIPAAQTLATDVLSLDSWSADNTLAIIDGLDHDRDFHGDLTRFTVPEATRFLMAAVACYRGDLALMQKANTLIPEGPGLATWFPALPKLTKNVPFTGLLLAYAAFATPRDRPNYMATLRYVCQHDVVFVASDTFLTNVVEALCVVNDVAFLRYLHTDCGLQSLEALGPKILGLGVIFGVYDVCAFAIDELGADPMRININGTPNLDSALSMAVIFVNENGLAARYRIVALLALRGQITPTDIVTTADRGMKRSTVKFVVGLAMYCDLMLATFCHLAAEVRRCLSHSPVDLSWKEVELHLELATKHTPWEVPDADPTHRAETLALLKATTWCPRRHALYHRGVREAVATVLLTARRLEWAVPPRRTRRRCLPLLPLEMWLHILSFLRREHFAMR
jgi:hypothetical protein